MRAENGAVVEENQSIQGISPAQRDALDGLQRDPALSAPGFTTKTNTLEVSSADVFGVVAMSPQPAGICIANLPGLGRLVRPKLFTTIGKR